MIWRVFHESVSFLFWVALAILVDSTVSNRSSAVVRACGKVEFAPRWFGVWSQMFVAIRMCFITWGYLRHGLREPLTFATGVLLGLGSVGMVFVLPGAVSATDSGLEEVFWLWRNKRILWKDIVEVNAERKGGTVTVIGADKTKIAHTNRLPDRQRFLLEIKHHCGENLPPDFPGMGVSNSGTL